MTGESLRKRQLIISRSGLALNNLKKIVAADAWDKKAIGFL
jgi:hypothetical protein